MSKRLGPNLGLQYRKSYYLKNPLRILGYFRHIYKEFYGIFHRGLYGWAEQDIWNFDRYLAEMMPEIIRKYKIDSDDCHTWPGLSNLGFANFEEEAFPSDSGGLSEDEYDKRKKMAEDTWDSMLEAMAVGFEQYLRWIDFERYDEFQGNKEGFHQMLKDSFDDPDGMAEHHVASVTIPFEYYRRKHGVEFDREGWDRLQSERLEDFRQGMALFTEWFSYLND